MVPNVRCEVEGPVRVVGLDQSYTGFGYCCEGAAEKKSFPPGKFKHPDDRLLGVEDWLHNYLVLRMPINLVVMEGYAPGSKFGREMAGELGWAVKRTVYKATGTHVLIVPPPSLKKFVTGKGNAKKNEMLLGVYRQWGVEFSDDNQADAFALEKFGRAWLAFLTGTPPKELFQYQIEAIEKVRSGK